VTDTLILAGGLSSRMGRDKATIAIDGVPLLSRIYDVVMPFSDRIYVITPWIDRYHHLLPPECQWIEEKSPHLGPLNGFAQALPSIESEWVLLLACDLPNLTTDIFRSHLPQLARLSPETVAYLPIHPDKGWEPLCGYYRTNCLPQIERYLMTGKRSMLGWLATETVAEMAIENREYYLFNCNTPTDLPRDRC
jgi:molybdenum cofactor guanylyltransferase